MAKTNEPDKLQENLQHKLKDLHTKAEEERAKKEAGIQSLPYLNTHAEPIDGAALTLRPIEAQKSAQAVIIKHTGKTLTVGTLDPQGAAFKVLTQSLEDEGYAVDVVVVSRSSLEHAWEMYQKFAYLNTRITGEVAVTAETLDRFSKELASIDALREKLEAAEAKDIPTLVELFLGGAVALAASDIHVEPQESGAVQVRYRLDGVLHDLATIKAQVAKLLIERVKLLASLKLNVHDTAQDGRYTIAVQDRDIEIRASILPGPRGEYLVMRLLDPRSLIDIPQLGLRPDLFEIIEEELARPNGMLLTTGPTGSGKTTLLYASLRRVATREVKVITIEDPIEYKLEGIEQTQVDAAEGYTFALGLRSIVRQDPDIILVGEIRDNETADIALQAALTGHLVFSTLHTNDAAGAIPRLIELGSHAETIAPSINVVMAQRLVRRACNNCRSTYVPSDELLEKLRIATSRMPEKLAPGLSAAPELVRVQGCEVCRGTGYTGRIGIFELFRIDDAAEELIAKHPTTAEVREHAIANGMVTLQQDALLHALNQITTIEDVVRVTGPLRAPHEEHGEDLKEKDAPHAM